MATASTSSPPPPTTASAAVLSQQQRRARFAAAIASTRLTVSLANSNATTAKVDSGINQWNSVSVMEDEFSRRGNKFGQINEIVTPRHNSNNSRMNNNPAAGSNICASNFPSLPKNTADSDEKKKKEEEEDIRESAEATEGELMLLHKEGSELATKDGEKQKRGMDTVV